jgi:hypothetical protein
MAITHLRLRGFMTNIAIFSLSCIAVMIHFVFSRAFRDSLLGNGLPIHTLPGLILIGTALALILSFLLSWFFRQGGRSNVIRGAYLISGAAELFLAFGHVPPRLAYEAFYILVSASTAIGLSLVWMLANDWISDDVLHKSRAVGVLLVSGTAGGLLAGFGLVHLRFAESFAGANIFLAAIDILTAALLSFHPECRTSKKLVLHQPKPRSAANLSRARMVAFTLAGATVLGSTGSTLLDLTYRISAAQQYTSRIELLHFFGHLQAILGVAAVVAQLGLSRYKPRTSKRSTMATYALLEVMAGGLAIVVPSFAFLTAMRTGEYALRNSFFRFGKEMTYASMPHRLRLESRPIIDVAGERIGDGIAAGLLQSLFWFHKGFPLRIILVCLTLVSCLLWKVCDRLAKVTGAGKNEVEGQPSEYEAVAQDGGMLLNASSEVQPMSKFYSSRPNSLPARQLLYLLPVMFLLFCAQEARSQQTSAPPDPQTSRADEITAAENAKAQHLLPLEMPRGERDFVKLEDKVFIPLFEPPNGFGAMLGGLPTGAGFSLGPQYARRDLFRDNLVSDTYVVGSTKLWWRGQTSLEAPSLLNGHLSMGLDAAYEDAASVFFYGEGPESSTSGKSNFRREFTTAHFESAVHLGGNRLVLGYRLGGLLVHIGPGRLSDPTTTLYTATEVPGLDQQPQFITGTGFVHLDFTKHGFANPSGFKFLADNTQFWDKTYHAYSFDLLGTQAEYYYTFANGMRTLAFRARNETSFVQGSNQVPFYLQPTLGSSDDLRGYDRYRFYGNGSSLVNAEYRWSVAETLEMAIFADGGNVYQRPGLIGARDMRGDGGIGFRFKNKDATVMRFDLGFSPEGVHVWFVFNPIFVPLHRSF